MGMKIRHKQGFYEKHVKRPMDFIISLFALIVLSPVFACVAFLVKINLGSPVLFKQKRPGLNEKIFVMYKFRTMTDKRDKKGRLLPDDKRLTRFGKFLRASSLDELPELINILKSEMSLVGPRPLLVEYLPRYNTYQRRRHEVKPGLTGYAQVNGRNEISWKKKFIFDMWYVRNVSFLLDIKIIIQTIKRVLNKDGVNSKGSVTMEIFRGGD